METINLEAQVGKLKGYFVVRDKHGNVKFDDWHDIPEGYHAGLTESDWAYIKKMRGKPNGSNTSNSSS